MRAVIQRVTQAAVTVKDSCTGQIETGLLVLLGVASTDTADDLEYVLNKTINLRVFDDHQGKMNLALKDVGGKLLVVSQFTLLGDVSRGNRPSFIGAANPMMAKQMYQQFIYMARQHGIEVETGIFQASMQVALINQGPVTIIIDSQSR